MLEGLDLLFGVEPTVALAMALMNSALAGGLAAAAVAVARPLARRTLGVETACQLWAIPPAVAVLAVIVGHGRVAAGLQAAPFAPSPQLDLALAVWALGAVSLAAGFTVAQALFVAKAERGHGGPAVVGLISPRIYLPAADEDYSAEERELIRAHEREHVRRKDPRAAAFWALIQCLGWFNPLAHLAAHLLRLDQELVCDAAVVRSRPTARGLYARTLLKTQLATSPLPFGCYWGARGAHPLEVRIGMLKPRAGGARSGRAIVQASGEAIRP